MVPTFLAKEEIAGYWWDIYRNASGRLVGFCEEIREKVEGENRDELDASAHEVVSVFELMQKLA